ncbi:EF-hand domain-containing protein [Jannaschia sp. KMU-145]|uniref:EF-hand domain-containing protein n=1 Tax=Jannaschia halovivens TaxID=3388667 RepID=UPI00396B0A1D
MIRPAALLLAALAATSALAQETVPASATVDAARAQIEALAAEMDVDGDARITLDELQAAAGQIFPSIDADASDGLTRAEFLGWEFGLAEMAAFRGRTQGYEAAMGMVFDLFDRDGSQGIDAAEFEAAMVESHAYADLDGDAALSAAEFRSNFVVNVALRNALVPQEVLGARRP